MNITNESIIGEIVAKDYKAASVFKQYEIDFCCNGNKSLEEVCSHKNIPIEELKTNIQTALAQHGGDSTNYNSWPLDLLADYIEKKHHRYVNEKIPEIITYLDKIMQVHGDSHPELYEINKLFKESAGELSSHMKKEELILFPSIRKMVDAKQKGEIEQFHFGSIQNPIKMMMHEHDNEGERFRKISTLCNQYTPPSDACNTYRVTLSLLKEFEEDLHLHIHLENNILFPKSVELEEQIANN
ncbi:MAG: iron-sulfur cluster repair di-iron protein [Chitinophagaceae bacterium]|nr:MAG: iron-sulfur cluster repair di-iron protein [Bacteroidetes bacterium OLB11]MCC6448533.1 iron-sulfur cluster repair di-iron protein [Chitinophagaceae bacterium]HMN32866.1 iron-sulfur cluster repair di-iron protein [Chitinophagaceae bacterium]